MRDLSESEQLDDARKALMKFLEAQDAIRDFALGVSSILKFHNSLIKKLAEKFLDKNEIKDSLIEMQKAEIEMFDQVKNICQMSGVCGVEDMQKLWAKKQ